MILVMILVVVSDSSYLTEELSDIIYSVQLAPMAWQYRLSPSEKGAETRSS